MKLTFARLSKLLGLRSKQPSTASLNELHCRLLIVLMRLNAQALLAHALPAVARELLYLCIHVMYNVFKLINNKNIIILNNNNSIASVCSFAC